MGDPGDYKTDIGPVIDPAALTSLTNHVKTMQQQAKLLYQHTLHNSLRQGSFFRRP
jgi:RHH-type proline utilization regulon transcriptional repressor/proline dehydrogenase/delta 1-pyrroline-5-carboxylate dehydrogenase